MEMCLHRRIVVEGFYLAKWTKGTKKSKECGEKNEVKHDDKNMDWN